MFRAGGSKATCTHHGVALGTGLRGRLGIGVSGSAAAGGAVSWVMSGGGLLVVIGVMTTASVDTRQLFGGILLPQTGRLPPLEVVLSPPSEIMVLPPVEVVSLCLLVGAVLAALDWVVVLVKGVVPAVGWR